MCAQCLLIWQPEAISECYRSGSAMKRRLGRLGLGARKARARKARKARASIGARKARLNG